MKPSSCLLCLKTFYKLPSGIGLGFFSVLFLK